MSNVLIGGLDGAGKSWAFYETNGCGMGARPDADGIDGIQCHMTNTLNTPIEAIEREYPILVTRYEFAERARRRRPLPRRQRTGARVRADARARRPHRCWPSGTPSPARREGRRDGAPGAHVFVKRGGGTRDCPPRRRSRWNRATRSSSARRAEGATARPRSATQRARARRPRRHRFGGLTRSVGTRRATRGYDRHGPRPRTGSPGRAGVAAPDVRATNR